MDPATPGSERPNGVPPPPPPGSTIFRADQENVARFESTHFHPSADVPPADTTCSELDLPATVDQYLLTEELARGGMGVIYRGREPIFERDLAVKVLLPVHARRPELHRRARTEALITAQLEHPGVVPVYAVGRLSDGRPYFGMRLVRGFTLADLIRDRPCPSTDLLRLLKVFEQVCLALAYAHSRGVVHRDVKPANVLVAPFGEVKLIDWGVAKLLPGSPLTAAVSQKDAPADEPADPAQPEAVGNTLHGVVVGTVEYMAPEQVRGELGTVDARADVFALGGMLCHLLTGTPPYVASSFRKRLERAMVADLGDAFIRLDASRADLPLVRLAKACLSPNPADRPANAGVVAAELAAHFEAYIQRPARDMARFFELSLDMFCIAGLDGYFKRVNENFSRTLGYSADELVLQPFRHFVHPDDWPATAAVMEDLNCGIPVVRFRNRYRDVRGVYHLFEWTAKAIPDEGTIFAVARDLSVIR